jgi:uncharacterized repeat protein (TIGR01451 family)
VRRIALLLIVIGFYAQAGLQYLVRSTPQETPLETASHDFQMDYETSGMSCDDAVDRNVPIGFSFPFNGSSYTTVNINSNGILYFDNKNNTEFSNSALPYGSLNQAIFPYWDDLNMGDCNNRWGSIRYETYGTAPNRHFVVSWSGLPHYYNSGSYTFQVVLYENGAIRFRYDASSSADGSSATIGVQEDGNHYDQYSYNSAIDPHKDVLYSPHPPPTDSDYSDYHFDELYYDGTNGEIHDSHNGYHGTGHDTPVVAGKICNAIDLRADGTSDYATLPSQVLDGAHDFTIAVWHKAPVGSDSNSLLSGARNGQYNALIFWMRNQTTFAGYIDNQHRNISTPNISDGTWHHLVWRKHGTETCFFFDGSKQGCKNFNQDYTLSIVSLILGQEQDSLGGGFDGNQDWEGIVDELLIFRRALSDSEIQTGYANQNAGKNWDGTPRVCPYPTVNKISCVIEDTVNGSSDPKRIPGSTIRYAVEVDNPNYSTIDNVVVEDSIDTAHLDPSTITNVKIDGSHPCNCLNPVSPGSNGPNGTGDGVNPVKLDFGSVTGGAKECGYFEVRIR